jgi:4-amino-4-deoxy-L-arabinose transferase-like glycosyltransferase
MNTAAPLPRAPWWPIVPVLCVAAALYLPSLGRAPAYLGGDEARFATGAAALASTGRDVNGERFPLLFHLTDSLEAGGVSTRWYQPILFYLIALTLKVAPLTEAAVRIPTVVVGLLNVFLIYAVARHLVDGTLYPILAALTLALSPAHFIFSRQALDYILPLPFVLGWLWLLLESIRTGSVWLSLGAGVVAGLGVYSYIAAWVMMPLCLALTWIVHWQQKRDAGRHAVAVAAGFALPMLILVAWLSSHPEMWRDTASRYQIYDAQRLSPLQGARDFLNYNNVQERISVYWDYFNPAYLFFSGGSNLTHTTRKAGVFLLPTAVLLLAGIYDLSRRRGFPASVVLLAGFALSPVPATLVDERYAVQRALFVLPFGVLISVVGAAYLLRSPKSTIRLTTMMLLAAMPIQFGYFYRDYFVGYRTRSAVWFDPVNVRGVAEYAIANPPPASAASVLLSEDLDDMAARWKFYMAKYNRPALLGRSRMVSADRLDVNAVAPGSLLVLYANDPRAAAFVSGGRFSVATIVVDEAGGRAAVILRKNA